MFKNIAKKLKISAIGSMAVGYAATLAYAICLINWTIYLWGALVAIGGLGFFTVLSYALWGLATLIEKSESNAQE